MSGLARVLVILVLLGVRTALALDPQRHITELAHRVWDSKSGVPADIRALAQTTDGYLWVGSYHGLYRFDGMQFQPFQSVSAARLPSQEISSLFATRDGRLWIGYRGGGVSVLERDKLINYNSVDGFPDGRVRGFAQDQQGRT
jgi:ligand-binding sensor domain-containing protein